MEKQPCAQCGTPIPTSFTFCPSCGRNQGGPPGAGTLVNRDLEHLKLLSVLYYVKAGLSAVFGTFPIIHLIVGIVMVASPDLMKGDSGSGPPAFFGFMFIGMASLFILGGWTCAVLQFLTARNLKRRRRKGLCMFTAGITCLFVPLGTVLGVFTFLVLNRPTVGPLFEDSAPTPGTV